MLWTYGFLPFTNSKIALALYLLKLFWFPSFPFCKAINIVFNGVLIPITDLSFIAVLVFVFNAYLGSLITL